MMAFTAVKVARRMTGGPGIKASCNFHESQSSRIITISFNRDAQVRHFGRVINPDTDRFEVQRGTDADKGKVLIQMDPEGEIQAGKSMHGSIRFRFQAFPPVPPGAVKSLNCILISSSKSAKEVVVRLPWNDGSRG